MKLISILAVTAVLASAQTGVAQRHKSEVRDGVRTLTPRGEDQIVGDWLTMEQRAFAEGFFSWPIPTEKVDAPTSRPNQVSACQGHHPDYKPAHGPKRYDDYALNQKDLVRIFIYEWHAYKSGIAAGECSCDTLAADWPQAVQIEETLTAGLNPKSFNSAMIYLRDDIKRDYDGMCDNRMRLILE